MCDGRTLLRSKHSETGHHVVLVSAPGLQVSDCMRKLGGTNCSSQLYLNLLVSTLQTNTTQAALCNLHCRTIRLSEAKHCTFIAPVLETPNSLYLDWTQDEQPVLHGDETSSFRLDKVRTWTRGSSSEMRIMNSLL